jgi:hypothetical protein
MKETIEELVKGPEELVEARVEDQQNQQHPVGCVQVVVEEPGQSQEERECQPASLQSLLP